MNNHRHVISLGGSLVAPIGGIDTKWLKSFHALIVRKVKAGHRFIIIVGGGQPARQYIAAARKSASVSAEAADWLGIATTHLNAQLLISIFDDLVEPHVVLDPTIKTSSRKPILVAGGYRPGNSTDYVAVLLAKAYKVNEILNLTNIDYVYDRNPLEYPDAHKIRQISWKDFYNIVGNQWHPGMNAPFDPIASRLAGSLKFKVLIANGAKLKNVDNYFEGKSFKGTIIS